VSEILEYFDEDHEYRIGGARVPSVTTVIGEHFPFTVPKEKLEFALAFGKAIHRATELHDRGTLNIETLDPRIVPYLDSWIEFKKQTGCEIVEIEHRVYDKVLRYAGTLDRVIRLDGNLGVLDLKRPKLDARVGVQLAGYQACYRQTVGPVSLRRWGLQLCPHENPIYRLREYKDKGDWNIFVACLTLHNWKIQHGY